MSSISKLTLASSMFIVLTGCVESTEEGVSSLPNEITIEIETDKNQEDVVIDVSENPVTNDDDSNNTIIVDTDKTEIDNQEESTAPADSQDKNNDETVKDIVGEDVTYIDDNVDESDSENTPNTGSENHQEDTINKEVEENIIEDTVEDTTENTDNPSSIEQPEEEADEANDVLNEANITDSTISAQYLKDTESALTNTPLMLSVKASIATIDNDVVELISPLNSANPDNVKRVESFLSEGDWDYIFPKRAIEYSYDKFLKAVGKFPAFCGDYEDGRDAEAICRKSLATMFAHFTQETGGHTAHWDVAEWRQGLVHIREMGWDEEMRGGYNGECNIDVWQGQTWPCGTFDDGEFKSYFGRGAKQLSYNYNYGPFSEAMFGDVSVLLNNPELVADTWLNLASAVFFYVYPQPPKPSMLHVIDGTWQPNDRDLSNGLTVGFGVTTQIINGGVECGGSTEIAQSLNRISYYQSFANYLGVHIPEDEVLGCAGMKQFDADGSGALNINWEQDWSYVAENPGGASYACKLVGYQTPFSVFKEGDYTQCVQHHFDVIAD